VKRLGLAFRFGFIFPVGGSVPVLFISMIFSVRHVLSKCLKERPSPLENILKFNVPGGLNASL
jgi:hypothetical protein